MLFCLSFFENIRCLKIVILKIVSFIYFFKSNAIIFLSSSDESVTKDYSGYIFQKQKPEITHTLPENEFYGCEQKDISSPRYSGNVIIYLSLYSFFSVIYIYLDLKCWKNNCKILSLELFSLNLNLLIHLS